MGHPFRAPAARRPQPLVLQPGDLVAFAGRGPVSTLIQLFTCSRWSHVAVCCRWSGRLLLVESTTLSDQPCAILGRPVNGVQAHDPLERIDRYPGQVWHCPLADHERLSDRESRRLTAFLLARLGTGYDARGAIESGTRWWKRRWWAPGEDLATLFCSELCSSALEHVRRFPLVNASDFTPAGLIREAVRIGVYQPPRRIK